MNSTAVVLEGQSLGSDSVRRWIVPGLGAGSAFLGFEMLVGAFTTSAWSFPQAIPQVVGWTAPTAAFDPLASMLGIAMHMLFSIGLGIVFGAIVARLGLHGKALLVAGVAFMWAESAISIWAVLHTFFPETLPILFAAVPFWASFVGRTLFGVILAMLFRR